MPEDFLAQAFGGILFVLGISELRRRSCQVQTD